MSKIAVWYAKVPNTWILPTPIRLGVTNFWPAIVIMLADQSVQLARDFAAMRGTWFMRVFSHILAIQLIERIINGGIHISTEGMTRLQKGFIG